MYQLVTNLSGNTNQVIRLSDMACIPFANDNTDYANFKREINEGTAQLQDADGNLMTAEQAKDLVKELP